MPLISVIIPVHNGEKTIRETIESVLKQTFSDFELIVINDGSQDSTLEIVQSISDPRLKVFSYNVGSAAKSRNLGFSHSCGEFIAFIDADDLWTPDKLESQLAALQEGPQAAVAYSWTDYIDECGQFLYPGKHTTASGDIYATLLVYNPLENGSNFLIRRQAFIEVGGFDESLRHSEDRDLSLRLSARYHFIAVPSAQVLYRQFPNSKSSRLSGMEAAYLQLIEKAFAQAPESLKHLKRQSLTNQYSFYFWKVISNSPKRREGLIAAKYFLNYVKNNSSLSIRQIRYILWMLYQIMSILLLPTQQKRYNDKTTAA